MPETGEKIEYRPIKEIYYSRESEVYSAKELQENENRILKSIEEAKEEAKKTGQIKKLKCFSSDSKEHRSLRGDYVTKKELVINEVFKELGLKEKEAKKFTKGEDVITLWPTKKEGVFAQKEEGLVEDRKRYTKGVVIASPEKTIEDVSKKLIEEIEEKKKE